MRKIFLYFSLLLFMQTAFAADSLFVRKPQIPILIDRTDNILVEMRVQAHKGDVLNKLSLQFKEGIDLNDIKALRFFYSGTEATSRQGKHYRPVSYISSHAEGKTKAANPAYSIKQSEVTDITNVVTFTSNQPMVEGVNYYWISIEMKPEASLLTTFTVQMPMAEINNMPATIVWDGKSDVRRMGIGVRHAGDDGASAYRIPGLVTTNNGTLLGVYDIRYNSSVDLQEMVDIGVSRSTDKGQTWEPMRVAMTFGETGGLPHAQNGVGDPSILVDEKTNTIWIVAAWTHGMGNGRAWWNSGYVGRQHRPADARQKRRRRQDLEPADQHHPAGERSFLVLPVARTGPGYHDERRDVGFPDPVHRLHPYTERRYHVQQRSGNHLASA